MATYSSTLSLDHNDYQEPIMIEYDLDTVHSILRVHPKSALDRDDFAEMTKAADRALGRNMTVFIRVTLERQSAALLQAFETAIQRCPDIISCHLMAGQYDYTLVVKVADISDYEHLHQKELSRLPGVVRIESNFAVREVIGGGSPAPL